MFGNELVTAILFLLQKCQIVKHDEKKLIIKYQKQVKDKFDATQKWPARQKMCVIAEDLINHNTPKKTGCQYIEMGLTRING